VVMLALLDRALYNRLDIAVCEQLRGADDGRGYI
jgi:hypothetical protein